MEKFRVHDEEFETYEEAEKSINDEMIDEEIDEIFGNVLICGNEYRASEALKNVSSIEYRCLIADLIDSMIEEIG